MNIGFILLPVHSLISLAAREKPFLNPSDVALTAERLATERKMRIEPG
jgi:hypothetical protein